MELIALLKSIGDRLPDWAGAGLAHLPYEWRPGIGSLYRARHAEIEAFNRFDSLQRRQYIFERVYRIVDYAIANVAFYHQHYSQHAFSLNCLRSFDDIRKIPIVSKKHLQDFALNSRSTERRGRYIANTGGSSGEPLSFYVEPSCVAHEWAHMHVVWGKLGYRPCQLKLAFVGRSDMNEPVYYDPVRHHYWVNIFMPPGQVVKALTRVIHKKNIRFLHGYPSAIHDFAAYCEEHAPDLVLGLRKTLAGILLGSEYPAPCYREKIETVFEVSSVSWYGHTERAILAYERSKPFFYEPLQTYGYCEAVADEETGKSMLVGTSYYNFASPFIRYWTGDLIRPHLSEGGLLGAFEIADGRSGEFIVDRRGQRIPLTGLIFGRHHGGFDLARSVQVEQKSPGRAKVVVCPLNGSGRVDGFRWQELFDFSGVAIDFEFEEVSQPIKTKTGKVKLLIRQPQYDLSVDTSVGMPQT